MFQSLKSQRTSLVPQLKFMDSVAQIKQNVDDTLDICWAAVAPKEHPESGAPGQLGDDVPIILSHYHPLPGCHWRWILENYTCLTLKV